jgi:6-phosphogluconolactonase
MMLLRFASAEAAASALAVQVAEALRIGVATRGMASMALPGGRTPVPLFHALRDVALEWGRVNVTLTDERWVPEDDAASNAALVRSELLSGRAAHARLLPLYDGSPSASEAAAGVWDSLGAIQRPFDAVVLGMGEDGHFASLFAGNEALATALDPVGVPGCVAMRAPVKPHERISLNLAALLQSRRLFLLVSGSAKRELLLAAGRSGRDGAWPVAALLAQRRSVPEVYWAP